MPVRLNHTIVLAKNNEESAKFYADILGLRIAGRLGPFVAVETANEVSLDFMTAGDAEIPPQHYAFLVSENEWDEIFTRIQDRGLPYWADPFHNHPGRTNTDYNGRGVYFEDPNGHSLEILTAPYILH
ncbi:VOC family protein [Actinophytocola sp.]|uniref:VOC family protein n=1 Tax=Actinophytocola sp. TaxID=1872138 RepID=UPI00389A8388